jgi:hypothetical protein
MRQGWKALAERADNPNFTPDQVAEAVCPALADDWRAEVATSLVDAVASVLGDGEQSGLFVGDADELARIRARCDSPLAAAFVDAASDVLVDGIRGPEAIRQAVEAALLDRSLRESRSVEEHYLRKSDQARAANMRQRLEGAVGLAALGDLARVIGQGASTARRFTPAKRDGLEEGVPL